MNTPLRQFTEIRSQLIIGKLTLAVILVLCVIGQVSAKAVDTTPPEISNFSFTPSTIDTTNSSQTVTVTIRATDAGRGVSGVTVRFRSLIGNQFVNVFMDSRHLISGDSKDGVYSASAIFPQYSKAGMWNVFEMDASDGINLKFFYSSELIALGFATELQVISNNEDTTPPEISEFSFTPTAVNTTNGSQNVTVTVRVKDVKAGVRNVSVGFSRSDYVYGLFLDSSNRISGDDKDGVYRKVITFSQNTPSGIYRVYVAAYDALSNNKFLNSVELTKLGYPSRLMVNTSLSTVVSISGKVETANGRGVSKAIVTLTEANGNVRYAVTNPFGYFRFDQIKVGDIYTLNAKHKRYIFTPQVHLVDTEEYPIYFIDGE